MTSLTALANLIFQNLLGDCLRKQTLFIQPPNDVTDDPGKFDIPEPIGELPAEVTGSAHIPYHTTPHYNLFTVWAARGHSYMPLQG